MDLLQIQYIIAIAESESMTAAASKMYVSQSALSLSYKKLERELGVSLFYKQGRKLELTETGEIFYAKAKRVIEALNDLRGTMKEIEEEQEQKFLVCTEAVDYTDETIKIYSRLYPEIFFQQVRCSTEEIATFLACGTVDFAITLSPDFGSGTEARLLLEEPMLLLVPQGGKYAEREIVRISELSHERIITLREGFAINNLFRSFFEAAGSTIGPTIEVNDPETIVMQVSSGYGISFIPESTANLNAFRHTPAVVGTMTLPLGDDCKRCVYLVTAKGRKLKKQTQKFLNFLIRFGKYMEEHQCAPAYENISELLVE